jgi:molybdopterin-guanine dinucleotide biosynthesis protein A
LNELTVAIMAGGKSSRMGTDKAFVPLLGMPMIEHVLKRVKGLGRETTIITNRPSDYAYLGLPMFEDVYVDHGPLGGIHSAVTNAEFPHTLIVACDMPWLNRPILEHMIEIRKSADIIVPRWDKYPEPLHAVYSQVCSKQIETNLRAKRLKITAFFGRVNVHYLNRDVIKRFDPEGRSFVNVNTPEDLAVANSQMLSDSSQNSS